MLAHTRYRFSLLCATCLEAASRKGDVSCGVEGRGARLELRRRLRIV